MESKRQYIATTNQDLPSEKKHLSPLEILGITISTEILFRIYTNPFFTCQNQIIRQISNIESPPELKNLSIFQILKARVNEGGFRSLYTGTLSAMGFGLIRSGTYFPLYELCNILPKNKQKNSYQITKENNSKIQKN